MEAFGRLSGIEVIYLNAGVVLAGEKVSTVGELDLARAGDRKFLELL